MTADSQLKLLAELVGINSVFPNEGEISRLIQSKLSTLGFQISTVNTAPNRPNVVATFGKADRYLAFYSHIDTVPPAADYKHDPFILRVDGNFARGLGASDTKGGTVCLIAAAEYAAKKGIPVKIVLGVDEENISQGAHDLVDSGQLSEVAFLISEEGGKYCDQQPFALVYGYRGRFQAVVEVYGIATHLSDQGKGRNAILAAYPLIDSISKLTFPAHPRMGQTSVTVDSIDARPAGLSIPDRCQFTVSFLTTPGVSQADCLRSIEACAEQLDVQADIRPVSRKTPFADPYEIDSSNSVLQNIEKTTLAKYDVTPAYCPSVADENIFANRLNIPVLCIGPTGGGAHSADEWVELTSMGRVVEVYCSILDSVQSL